MPSVTRTWGRVFWLLCAAALLPCVAAAASSPIAADLVERLWDAHVIPESHQPAHRIPSDLTLAAARRHVGNTDADSESGEHATACSVTLVRFSPRAPSLEDVSARVVRGIRSSCLFPLVSRFAPRPPPAPLPL